MKLGLEKRNLPKIVSSDTIFKRMKSVLKIKKEKKKRKKGAKSHKKIFKNFNSNRKIICIYVFIKNIR